MGCTVSERPALPLPSPRFASRKQATLERCLPPPLPFPPPCRQFFQSGKTLAIERGRGLQQPIMRSAAREVGQGGWLHVFPEGRVNRSGTLGPLRWGVGKVVCDAVGIAGEGR